MGPIIQGAAAGILGDKTGEALYGKGHLEDSSQQTCLHNDLHRIVEALQSLIEDPAWRGTPRPVAASVNPVIALEANEHRKGVSIYNASSATMYVGLFPETMISTSLYTAQVPTNTLYEIPTGPIYKGEISAVWASATGVAMITELT